MLVNFWRPLFLTERGKSEERRGNFGSFCLCGKWKEKKLGLPGIKFPPALPHHYWTRVQRVFSQSSSLSHSSSFTRLNPPLFPTLKIRWSVFLTYAKITDWRFDAGSKIAKCSVGRGNPISLITPFPFSIYVNSDNLLLLLVKQSSQV